MNQSEREEVRMISEDRFTFVPVAQAIIPPPGLIEHLKDRWWLVHPEKGIAFFEGKFAQCNSNKAITERLAQPHSWATVKFIPSVFRRIDIRDYAC
jgi:hypothetical protein